MEILGSAPLCQALWKAGTALSSTAAFSSSRGKTQAWGEIPREPRTAHRLSVLFFPQEGHHMAASLALPPRTSAQVVMPVHVR